MIQYSAKNLQKSFKTYNKTYILYLSTQIVQYTQEMQITVFRNFILYCDKKLAFGPNSTEWMHEFVGWAIRLPKSNLIPRQWRNSNSRLSMMIWDFLYSHDDWCDKVSEFLLLRDDAPYHRGIGFNVILFPHHLSNKNC